MGGDRCAFSSQLFSRADCSIRRADGTAVVFVHDKVWLSTGEAGPRRHQKTHPISPLHIRPCALAADVELVRHWV